ncbi:MAG: stage II sporulation protein M [Bacteroidota bacterium]
MPKNEVAFLKRRAERWQAFEDALDQPKQVEPDALAEQFIEVTDDLSYACTFFPGSKTTRYINGLTAQVQQTLYRNKREDRRRLVTFWTEELPLVLYRIRVPLLVSLLVFLIANLVGIVSAVGDDGFVRLIMGDGYVNMTEDNIARGDPLAVYKKMNPTDMFLYITFNNVRVSFLAFAAGLFFAVGSGYVLFTNGVMVGAFLTMFWQNALLGPALKVIYIHGALELSAIVIAGAAGMRMGLGFIFPGTYPRLVAFRNAAKDGLKTIIGLVPVFITAGFLEGFVTRYTEMPLWLSLAIIIGSFAFIGWYVAWLPHRVHRRMTQPALA